MAFKRRNMRFIWQQVALIFFLSNSLWAEPLRLSDPVELSAAGVFSDDVALSLGFGSGLELLADGSLVMVSDRGATVGEGCGSPARECGGRRYGAPNFRPGIVLVPRAGKAFANPLFRPLFRKKKGAHQYTTGVEQGCRSLFSKGMLRIDPEAITVSSDGKTFWIGEEYGPSLFQGDLATGEILQHYRPGAGLPKFVRRGYDERGFEAIAAAEDGTIWFALQAVLDLKGSSPEESRFIRFFRFFPTSERIEMYGYSLRHLHSQEEDDRLEVKIAGMAALSQHRLLVLERQTTAEGERYALVIVRTSGRQPLPAVLKKGDISETKGGWKKLTPSLLPRLREIPLVFSGTPKKLEGVAYNERTKEIFLSVDNDFGVSEQAPCGESGVPTLLYRARLSL
ncbi:esterase-like activity of phytase family protein [bacterium]|nr:esterase-like activity of phytase family protein [bacterium]